MGRGSPITQNKWSFGKNRHISPPTDIMWRVMKKSLQAKLFRYLPWWSPKKKILDIGPSCIKRWTLSTSGSWSGIWHVRESPFPEHFKLARETSIDRETEERHFWLKFNEYFWPKLMSFGKISGTSDQFRPSTRDTERPPPRSSALGRSGSSGRRLRHPRGRGFLVKISDSFWIWFCWKKTFQT